MGLLTEVAWLSCRTHKHSYYEDGYEGPEDCEALKASTSTDFYQIVTLRRLKKIITSWRGARWTSNSEKYFYSPPFLD